MHQSKKITQIWGKECINQKTKTTWPTLFHFKSSQGASSFFGGPSHTCFSLLSTQHLFAPCWLDRPHRPSHGRGEDVLPKCAEWDWESLPTWKTINLLPNVGTYGIHGAFGLGFLCVSFFIHFIHFHYLVDMQIYERQTSVVVWYDAMSIGYHCWW